MLGFGFTNPFFLNCLTIFVSIIGRTPGFMKQRLLVQISLPPPAPPVCAFEGLVVFIAGEHFFLQDTNLSFRLLLVVYIISTGLPVFYEYFHITTSILLALLKGSFTLPSSCLYWPEIIYLEPDFKLWQDSSFIFNYHLFLTYSLNL